MPATVLLPNALRPFAAGNDRVPLDAATVGQALEMLVERYPALRGRLPEMGRAGQAIYRNGSVVHKLQGLETPLRDGDRLTIIVPEGEL